MGPTVLMDVPGIGKETVARVVVGVRTSMDGYPGQLGNFGLRV